jgi:hypothetical protein
VDTATAGSALCFFHNGVGGYLWHAFTLAGTAGTAGFTLIPDGDYDQKIGYYVHGIIAANGTAGSQAEIDSGTMVAISANVSAITGGATVTVDGQSDGSMTLYRSGTTGTVTGILRVQWI